MPVQPDIAGVEVLLRSRAHAQRLGQNYVDTEHLLLAVLERSDRDPALQYIMQRFDLSEEMVEAVVLQYVHCGEYTGRAYRPDTERLTLVLQNAQVEATMHCSEYVRPHHLLLALIPSYEQLGYNDNTGVAGFVLTKLGLVKEEVVHELKDHERRSHILAMADG